ncbi:YcdB/YcdC domain-containing protein [Bacillus sp. REN16]|uniref:YcdB/YcdC domain-containing protein n=1 Tax=Bacillus sp. REN16 TaxID=2887296 RepID=UPI001E3F9236|nr:YcdB/YcdC domain-containing protein [Bacillus sp. REN16]MCC3357124.1 hypothetical protein [Bacillus sp. REN16]
MSKMIEKLQSFLPVKAVERVSEFDEEIFDIVDYETEEVIGSYSMNENGELVTFSLIEDVHEGNLTKEQMATIVQNFVDTFFPGKKEFELSAILDLDNPYMITYEKRDEKYGLFLHSTGFTVSVSTSGQITSFHSTDEEYEVRYTEIVVSEEEALETYIEGLDFELNIQQFDSEVFKNGDNQYHLAYSVIEQIMDIPVDGSDSTSISEEYAADLQIEKQEFPAEELYELVSLTSEYTLLDSQVDDKQRIEVWSKQDLVESYTFDMEDASNHVVKLCIEKKTGLLLQLNNGEEHDNSGDEIGIDKAKVQLLKLLFNQFPDAHERFKLEIFEYENDDVEDELGEDFEDFEDKADYELEEDMDDTEFLEFEEWDEEFVEVEETYTFYVHLFHHGLRIANHVSVIQVGRYTGKIIHFNLNVPSQDQYVNLPIKPLLSKSEAKEILKKYVKMEKMFIREYDEDGKSIYSLAYTSDFPETIGSVRAIDAVTGKAMYVDVGDATFIN